MSHVHEILGMNQWFLHPSLFSVQISVVSDVQKLGLHTFWVTIKVKHGTLLYLQKRKLPIIWENPTVCNNQVYTIFKRFKMSHLHYATQSDWWIQKEAAKKTKGKVTWLAKLLSFFCSHFVNAIFFIIFIMATSIVSQQCILSHRKFAKVLKGYKTFAETPAGITRKVSHSQSFYNATCYARYSVHVVSYKIDYKKLAKTRVK